MQKNIARINVRGITRIYHTSLSGKKMKRMEVGEYTQRIYPLML